MGVASHLSIEIAEYDARIRTFVPHYEKMIEVCSRGLQLLTAERPVVVDLGIGTGALSLACFSKRPDLQLIGIDLDPSMLSVASVRLSGFSGVTFVESDFRRTLPAADAFVACLALHHIKNPSDKATHYKNLYKSLRPGGLLLTGDCFPATDPMLAGQHRDAWIAHLGKTYSCEESENHLRSWANEDTYFPLDIEQGWLSDAGFRTEILWREESFAVLAGIRPS